MIILPLVKFIDKSLSTLKQITLFNGQYLCSSILEAISEIIFLYIVTGIVDNKNPTTILLIALAGAMGKYITCKLSDKFSKDKQYINRITTNSENKDEVSKLYHLCRNNGIKCIMLNSIDYDNKDSYTLEIYSETRSDSKIIDKFIASSSCKMLRKII